MGPNRRKLSELIHNVENNQNYSVWRDFEEGIRLLFLPISFVEKTNIPTENASSFRRIELATSTSNGVSDNLVKAISYNTFEGELDSEIGHGKTSSSVMEPFPNTYRRMQMMCEASIENSSVGNDDDRRNVIINESSEAVPRQMAFDSDSISSVSSDNPIEFIRHQNKSDYDISCVAAATRQKIMERQADRHHHHSYTNGDDNDTYRIPTYIYIDFNVKLGDV